MPSCHVSEKGRNHVKSNAVNHVIKVEKGRDLEINQERDLDHVIGVEKGQDRAVGGLDLAVAGLGHVAGSLGHEAGGRGLEIGGHDRATAGENRGPDRATADEVGHETAKDADLGHEMSQIKPRSAILFPTPFLP